MAIIDIASGKLTQIPSQYTSIQALTCRSNHAYFIGAAATLAAQVAEFDLAGESLTPAYKSGELPIASTYLARPETIQFPSGNATAHAFLYSPCNPDFSAPADSKPPLMVICHGGPTAACDSALNLKIQFWSSRGFAVLDVNYRGSSGYGRAYRDALKGQWGVVDVEDAINGARYLADKGQVNPQQMAIRGSSAGGFTVLSALTCHDTFKAGASLYGIGDLELLVADTHKFEAHYTDTLVGPYPQKKALYQQRSPINHIDALSCPVIFLQGLDDKVVPPKQAELMVAALRNKNIPVAYLSFAGEGHGFKKADNIKKALQAELYFYSRVFGFVLSEAVPAITIDNLVN